MRFSGKKMTNKFWLSRQTFKSMKLNWNFFWGGRVQNKKAFCGGVWIFSGNAQLNII